MTNPWEQLPAESSKAYAAFCVFRDMEHPRSLLGACRRKVGVPTIAKASGIFVAWASKYQWNERVRAYDNRLSQVENKAVEDVAKKAGTDWAKERARWNEAKLGSAGEFLRKAVAVLRSIDPAKATLSDAANLAKAASNLGDTLFADQVLTPVEPKQAIPEWLVKRFQEDRGSTIHSPAPNGSTLSETGLRDSLGRLVAEKATPSPTSPSSMPN